jgi:hypothetical protein
MNNDVEIYPLKPIYVVAGSVLIFLTVFGLSIVLWRVLGETVNAKLNRLGIILELLGIISFIPELLGERRVKGTENKLPSIRRTCDSLLQVANKILDGNIRFILDYIASNPLAVKIKGTGPIFLISSFIASLLLVLNMVNRLIMRQSQNKLWMGIQIVFGILAVIWILYVFLPGLYPLEH